MTVNPSEQPVAESDTNSPTPLASRRPLTGVVFGAVVGMLSGAPVAAGYCWLLGVPEYRWQGAIWGAALGPVGGALIGWRGRQSTSDPPTTNIATLICTIYGLLPALVLIFAAGLAASLFSVLILVGLFFVAPMFGFLLGALFDRAYEEAHKRFQGKALAFASAGALICLGVTYACVTTMPGPHPEELAKKVQPLILREWRKHDELRGATIQSILLTTENGREFSGLVEATIGGQPERLRVQVSVYSNVVSWKLEPLDE